MNDRVYVLLDVVEGKSREVVDMLSGKGGVVSADVVEDPPGVIMIVEAGERKQLAALTVQAIASVDNFTNGLRLLPVQSEQERPTVSVISPGKRHVLVNRRGATA